MRLANKVIIVTGSARGIGKAYALALAREGASVVVSDILEKESEQTVSEIESSGGKATYIRCDVSKEKETNALAEETAKGFGRIDVLVNNAAMLVSKRKPFYEVDVDEWDRLMSVNLRGTWLCTRSVFPYMKKQGGGKIVNVASGTFYAGTPNEVHYVASKGGVIGLTRALARELGQHSITINSISPGFTLTEAARGPNPNVKYEAAIAESRALKRDEYAEDLVGTMVFLCSKDSDFMTGQSIVVDGGRSLN
jgi:NAD(P)-dependent dehydrogenase (short-subunit alcohol dehydrogenase family)